MANQITIDIVAQTNKLTSGINDANGQIDGMSTKLKGIAGAAGIAAAGFLATKGLTFLSQAKDEAAEAEAALRGATTTFGEGSAALQKIRDDAEKFGKALSVDNDELIVLATQLGSRLPKEIQASSVELVKIFKDVEAFTKGSVTAEAASGKLAKAFADGELAAGELRKIFPNLEQATYDQAEALSKAGDNQGALNLLVDKGSIVYDDAAAKNVTSSQKFETALADLKEQIGGPVLQIMNRLLDALNLVLGAFNNLPGPVKNVIIVLGLLLTAGALTLTFLASMKASLVTLGISSTATAGSIGLATVATNLLNVALKAIPILAVISLIVLLVQNWDSVTAAVSKVWNMIKDVLPKAWAKVKEFKDKVVDFVGDIIQAYLSIPRRMAEVGADIVRGLWNGMQNMVGWLRDRVTGFFKNLLPSWAEKALGISSPSKVFAGIGSNIISGLQSTFNAPAVKAVSNRAQAGIAVPTMSMPSLQSKAPINITINAGLGTNGPALGRQVSSAIKQYGKISTKAVGSGGGFTSMVAL
jgi:hypothetical protein